MNIGLLGSQNSHAEAYGKAFNIEKRFPGHAISHLWGETPEHAAERAAQVQIPHVVDDPRAMVGEVDAVIIDTRDGANHPALAMPFLGLGIPLFIDKPLAAGGAAGSALLDAAAAAGTPVDCHSVIPLQQSFKQFMAAARALAPLTHLTLAMPAVIDSEYSGMFFYTIHAIECLCTLLERLPARGQVERFPTGALAILDYADGPATIINLQEGNYSYSLMAVGQQDAVVQRLVYDEDVFQPAIAEMVAFFEGTHKPASRERLLMPLQILDALEASKRQGGWVKVLG